MERPSLSHAAYRESPHQTGSTDGLKDSSRFTHDIKTGVTAMNIDFSLYRRTAVWSTAAEEDVRTTCIGQTPVMGLD